MSKSEIDELDRGAFAGDRILCLGNQAYYWSAGGGYQNEVVISAHGGIKRSATPNLIVPSGISLHYYVQHGMAQPDVGIDLFFYSAYRPVCVEKVMPGQKTYNYQLSKYQGKHAGTPGQPKETYEEIQRFANNAKLAANTPTQDIQSMRPILVDVVTIRNRWYSTGLDLQSVLDLLSKSVRSSLTVHCFFCRSFL